MLSGQRLSTIFHFTVDRMTLSDISCSFSPVNVLKHSRQGKKLYVYVFNKYPIDKLCVIQCLVEYLKRRNNRVDREQKLFITYGKPFKAASQDSMSRWIKDIFSKLKIFNFSPHSTRAASTSKAKVTGIAIDDILAKGCWSNADNFFNYYDKKIICHADNNVDFSPIMK